MTRRLTSIILLLGAAAIILLICTLQLPGDNFLIGEIQNTAHTVVFGLLSVVLLGLSRLIFAKALVQSYKHYYMSFVVTVFIGAAIEFIQIFGLRDADIWDLVRDMVGAAAFLGFYATVDPRVAPGWTKRVRIGIRFGSIAVLIAAFVPLALWLGAYLNRNAVFPQLLTFDSVWETKFLTTRNAEIDRVAPPADFTQAVGKVGRLSMFPGDYCGFRIAEPYPDWTGYDRLSFDVYSHLDTTVTLGVRIDDIHHNQKYEDRYNGAFTVSPGTNRLSIDLRDVRHAPSSREMDMTAILYVLFFTYDPKERLVLYLDRIRLE